MNGAVLSGRVSDAACSVNTSADTTRVAEPITSN